MAINSFCYSAQKCLKETKSKDRELKTIKRIVRNNNYKTNIVDKVCLLYTSILDITKHGINILNIISWMDKQVYILVFVMRHVNNIFLKFLLYLA